MKIYLEKPLPDRDSFTIDSDFWEHYLTTVRRMSPGDELIVAGTDRVAEATLTRVDPIAVRVHGVREAGRPGYRLWIVQALTRKKKFEVTVRRGAELGVTDFLPVMSEHTVRRPNRPEHQRERWRHIAVDATRITKRDWVPTVHGLTGFEHSFELLEDVRLLYGDEGGEAPVEAFEGESSGPTALVVGPEGGFTEAEKDRLLTEGASAVSLGATNFRAETASIALTVLWLEQANHLG